MQSILNITFVSLSCWYSVLHWIVAIELHQSNIKTKSSRYQHLSNILQQWIPIFTKFHWSGRVSATFVWTVNSKISELRKLVFFSWLCFSFSYFHLPSHHFICLSCWYSVLLWIVATELHQCIIKTKSSRYQHLRYILHWRISFSTKPYWSCGFSASSVWMLIS